MSNEKTKPNLKNWGLIDDDLDLLQVNEPKNVLWCFEHHF